MTDTIEEKKPTKRQTSPLSQADLPGASIDEAMRIPIALRDYYALDSATPLNIGKAIGIAPTSGKFRLLTGAAIAFGLTNGGYNAAEITLTDLGRKIVAPTEEGENEAAKREAFEKPRVIREFIAKYNGKKMPPEDICKNILVSMDVPYDSSSRAYELLTKGLKDLGYFENINGSVFVQRPNATGMSSKTEISEMQKPSDVISDDLIPVKEDERVKDEKETPQKSKPSNAIFLGHGKNRKPLEQLIKILDEYGIPHKEAIHEANAGRPIPVKVAETMHECGAAIIIFSADEKFLDADGSEVWRPSENAVHELGAASILYDNRIIIFKEDQVSLASNFSSIGYINFEKDELDAKGIELFRELVKFKIINVSVAS